MDLSGRGFVMLFMLAVSIFSDTCSRDHFIPGSQNAGRGDHMPLKSNCDLRVVSVTKKCLQGFFSEKDGVYRFVYLLE